MNRAICLLVIVLIIGNPSYAESEAILKDRFDTNSLTNADIYYLQQASNQNVLPYLSPMPDYTTDYGGEVRFAVRDGSNAWFPSSMLGVNRPYRLNDEEAVSITFDFFGGTGRQAWIWYAAATNRFSFSAGDGGRPPIISGQSYRLDINGSGNVVGENPATQQHLSNKMRITRTDPGHVETVLSEQLIDPVFPAHALGNPWGSSVEPLSVKNFSIHYTREGVHTIKIVRQNGQKLSLDALDDAYTDSAHWIHFVDQDANRGVNGDFSIGYVDNIEMQKIVPVRLGIYVNDTSTAGDSFTTAIGDDAIGLGTRDKPFRSIAKALSSVTDGETIFIDAGIYSESVVITKHYLTLIGVDSGVYGSVIEPAVSGVNGFTLHNCTGVEVKNFRVRGGYDGVELDTAVFARISQIALEANVRFGLYAHGGSNKNLISNVVTSLNGSSGMYIFSCKDDTIIHGVAMFNGGDGIRFEASNSVLIQNSAFVNNSGAGITLQSSSQIVLKNNLCEANQNRGVNLVSSNGNQISNNIVRNHLHLDGIKLSSSSNNNTLTGNIAENNGGVGIWLVGSSNDTLNANTSKNNGLDGFAFTSSSHNCLLVGNASENNGRQGYYFSSSRNHILERNMSSNNVHQGFFFELSDNNVLKGNVGRANLQSGFNLRSSNNIRFLNNISEANRGHGYTLSPSDRSYFIQNIASENLGYQFYIDGSSSGSIFVKNNISTSTSFPAGALFNTTGNIYSFLGHWWNTTNRDTVSIGISGGVCGVHKMFSGMTGRVDLPPRVRLTKPNDSNVL